MTKTPNYMKLRTNLRLSINRLKLLEKKKAELALKARKEIADYIGAGKDDRARIRVEHIIREDYLVEAMEIVEMFCDLLLARFGIIEKMKEMDPGLEEAIATLFWVAPRLSTDIQELKEVSNQLMNKYGKEYAEMCRKNGFENVNEKVLVKMSIYSPPKLLIENYMVEIARAYNVPFVPDVAVMEASNPAIVSDLISLGAEAAENMENERKDPRGPAGGPSGGGGGSPTVFGGGGGGGHFSEPLPPFHPGSAALHPSEALPPYSPRHTGGMASASGPAMPPPLPVTPPNSKGSSPQHQATAQGHPVHSDESDPEDNPVYDYALPPKGHAALMKGKDLPSYDTATGGADSQTSPSYGLYTIDGLPPRPRPEDLEIGYSDVKYGQQRSEQGDGELFVPVLPEATSRPSVRGHVESGKHNSDYELPPSVRPPGHETRNENIYMPIFPDIPDLPSVPTGDDDLGKGDDLDFDDLTNRFEALKKKK